MVTIQYQLTFEEFEEGMKLAQKRISTHAEKQTRKSGVFPLLIASVAAYLLLSLIVWPATTRPWRSDDDVVSFRNHSRTPLERMEPHLFWFGLFLLFVALLLLSVRMQMKRQRRGLWENLPTVQQVQTVTFDEDGVVEEHALARSFKRWTLFKRAEETNTLFVLLSSDYTLDMFPKRAFDESAAEAFRALARAKVQPPTNAFPVLPVDAGAGCRP